jgi:hypothetical protein
LCVAAANRELNTFAENLTDVVLKAAQTAIVALSKVCSSPRV